MFRKNLKGEDFSQLLRLLIAAILFASGRLFKQQRRKVTLECLLPLFLAN
jgi:hypothetical protein